MVYRKMKHTFLGPDWGAVIEDIITKESHWSCGNCAFWRARNAKGLLVGLASIGWVLKKRTVLWFP